MSERLQEDFREELLALLQRLEAGLLGLEGDRGVGALNGVFRTAHDLKSAAAMLGLQAVADAAHALESILDAIRRGERPIDPPTVARLLAGVDALRALTRGEDAPGTREALAALEGPPAPALAPAAPARPLPRRRIRISLALAEDALERALDPLVLLSIVAEMGTVEEARLDPSRLPELDALAPERLYLGFELVLSASASLDELRAALLFVEGAGTVELREEAPEPVSAGGGEAPEEPGEAVDTLVVGARRVDALVDLTSELLVATSRVEHLRREGVPASDGRLESACREALRLAGRVQEAAMAIRLVPLEPTFLRLRRFVRETAGRLGKEVEVEVSGGQTELDRSVAERLLGPLKHLVRNALDHGIEPPGERVAAGKAARGRLTLFAREERGQVVLGVEDDGRGLDPERIRAAAVARGLVADAALSEAEALELVFRPGFSTVQEVGELSGRGVGLDVVRRNLLDLGGDVRVWSEPGRGARFTLSVPLTLAVLEGLVVVVDGERLVVPRDAVVRLLQPRVEDVARLPDGRSVLHLPEGAVPLLRPDLQAGLAKDAPRGGGLALLVSLPGGRLALHVDEVLSQESVLLKPLHRGLRVGEGVLGAAILGDGRVALVLDLAPLCARGAGAERSVLRGDQPPMTTPKMG